MPWDLVKNNFICYLDKPLFDFLARSHGNESNYSHLRAYYL